MCLIWDIHSLLPCILPTSIQMWHDIDDCWLFYSIIVVFIVLFCMVQESLSTLWLHPCLSRKERIEWMCPSLMTLSASGLSSRTHCRTSKTPVQDSAFFMHDRHKFFYIYLVLCAKITRKGVQLLKKRLQMQPTRRSLQPVEPAN